MERDGRRCNNSELTLKEKENKFLSFISFLYKNKKDSPRSIKIPFEKFFFPKSSEIKKENRDSSVKYLYTRIYTRKMYRDRECSWQAECWLAFRTRQLGECRARALDHISRSER